MPSKITNNTNKMGSDPTRIQFFIRMNPIRVFVANSTDSIRSIHEKIQSSTGIPVTKQRLIYRGKHLELDRTLTECGVQNDTELQLSTGHHKAWKLVDDVVSFTRYLSKKKPSSSKTLKSMIVKFLNMTPQNDVDKASAHLQVFASSRAPRELIKLYVSSHRPNRESADEAIREFISISKRVLPERIHHKCAPIFYKFFKLLSMAGKANDPLYCLCMFTLRAMLECPECGEIKGLNALLSTNVGELVAELARDLDSCAETTSFHGPSSSLVEDFTKFLRLVRVEIEENLVRRDTIAIIMCEKLCGAEASYAKEITYLHEVFLDILSKLEKCFVKIETHVDSEKKQHDEAFCLGNCKYLCLLEGLGGVSKIYNDWEEAFWETLKRQKNALSCLIVKYVNWDDDYNWILKYKEVINFEARRHLAMTMLSEVEHDFGQRHEMLISRSNLWAESFEHIAHVHPYSLCNDLFVEFKNEEATGPGVLREWFFLVCQEMVNPLNSLFLACPNDRQRFFPNPASRVDRLHLEYFCFCGRVIGLALVHNVHVGIVFDRVFFLQLAGYSISLEDIRDTDPFLYRSCKQILDMDPEVVDQDALGLTFVHEVEEMGTKKVFELCPGGRSMVVNSKNRNQFVDSLIKHRFVTAIREQVAHFARGFTHVMNCQWPHEYFFHCLDLEDLDWILRGSESAISVDDWKAHTDYHGFKETDPQISWFWEIVGHMAEEQKRALLFFWTSIKYLPIEGFVGLASRLCIDKMIDSRDLLPSSHTCFNQLCLPDYHSFDVMRDHLNIITQDHVGCSFGEV